MRQWLVLVRKEMLELWRSRKWLWVPLVFLVLGAMQPLAAYYMPEILDTFGGLPEGAVIEIPPPLPGAAVADALNQLGTLGVLVLALAGMGAVATERSSGAAAMVLVKPVSRAAYLLAKWAAYNLLMLASVAAGLAAAAYYTALLIGPVAVGPVLGVFAVFCVWLSFLLTVLIAAGVVLRSAAAVAFVTLAVAVVLALATSLLAGVMAWSPARLSSLAPGILAGTGAPGLALPLAVTAAAIAALLAGATSALRRRPMVPG